MSTSVEYIEHVCEQINSLGAVRYRKMFGEYMVYLNDKPVLTVCDNTVFVKMLPQLQPLMDGADTAFPYEGAKEHYILDTDDRETMLSVVRLLEEITPVPKKKIKSTENK